ncbi:MAG TPA: solute:sodium symporter family transporter [Planctomycetes bacterium]|nr:solute:sodium symporter family transporter [Planctomycetota bacterium]
MTFTALDWTIFLVFVLGVLGFALWKARRERTSEDFFLAGRNLTWWLIGISMLAANISTEHFVGMSGRGFELGLAIASYEWTAALAIVLVAWVFLPGLLRSGIYTIPEYLEYRYSTPTRALMAAYMAAAYIFVALASVLYSGALGVWTIFDFEKVPFLAEHVGQNGMVWIIAAIAGLVMVAGGLKAVAWTDLFCALGIVCGGALLLALGWVALCDGRGFGHGVARLTTEAGEHLSTVKPWNHGEMPWVAVFIGGLWIPQLFYWGLNQFIIQRALAARSLAEAQKGVLLTACLKLIVPFIIVFPGIMAYVMYRDRIPLADKAYPFMVKTLLPAGLKGLMLAALFGAVVGALTSMLSALSSILTMDLYKRHLRPGADGRELIAVGRVVTVVFAIVACVWASYVPALGGGSVFKYIQTVWGFITPGIVTAFLFGICVARTPAVAATGAMLLGVPIYALCLWALPEVAFLHHQAISFIALCAYVMGVSLLVPLSRREGEADELHAGRLTRVAIPVVTACIGAVLFAGPLTRLAGIVIDGAGSVGTFRDAVIGVAGAAVFGLVTVLVMRAPTPMLRLAAASAPARLGAGAMCGLAAGAAVIAVHAYLFADWIIHPAPAMDGAALPPFVLRADTLLAAAAVVGLFAAGFIALRRIPAAAPRRMPVTKAIDLTPSRAAYAWGIIVIAAVVVLYAVFP